MNIFEEEGEKESEFHIMRRNALQWWNDMTEEAQRSYLDANDFPGRSPKYMTGREIESIYKKYMK